MDDKEQNKKKRASKIPYVLTQPFGVKLLKNMLMHGRPDVEIAEALDITTKTLRNWKERNKEFCDFCDEWKSRAPEMAKRSLFMQAVGYEKSVPIRNSQDEIIGYKTEFVPPKFEATKFFLLNKAPDEYRDKIDIEGSMNVEPVRIEFVRKKPLPGLELPAKQEEKKENE